MNVARLVLFSLLMAILASCNSDNGPEGKLREFILYRTTQTELNKDKILSFLTGDIYDQFSAMDDEMLKSYWGSGIRQKDLDIVSVKCDGEKCFVTYSLKYQSLKDGQPDTTTTVKKIAELLKIGNSWKISKVDTLKTFHDSDITVE